METNGIDSRHERLLNVLFICMASATLLIRVVIFEQYSRVILDSDQPIMWTAAHDYARGIFNEPRFYAQDYNTHMESLFAVPLLWMEVPVYYALPLATHFLFVFPYLFSAVYLFFRRKKIQAIALLSVLLCMPAAFDLMNSISRGFVTSLFFASFFVINVLEPRKLQFLSINTALAVIGYFVSPVSLLATVPLSFYFFLFNYRNPSYYKMLGFCLALALPLHWIFNQFYLDHPEYIVLGLQRTFSLDSLWFNISNLDVTFDHLSFFLEGKSILVLLAWTSLMLILYRRNKNAFWAFSVFLFLVLGSFSMDKSTEGTSWLFGARSRLYLPVPFMLGIFPATFTIRPNRLIWAFVLPLMFASYKMLNYERLLAWHFDEKNHWGVILTRLDRTLEAIDTYKRACLENRCPLIIVSGRFWLCTHIGYGGPAIDSHYPMTELTNTERRYRVREENKDKVFDKFILISIRYDFHEKVAPCRGFEIRKLDEYGMFLITANRMKTGDFIELVNQVEERDTCICR